MGTIREREAKKDRLALRENDGEVDMKEVEDACNSDSDSEQSQPSDESEIEVAPLFSLTGFKPRSNRKGPKR